MKYNSNCRVNQAKSCCVIDAPPPNNSFNRSANSVAFICETMLIIMARRARLIRALGVSIPSASQLKPTTSFESRINEIKRLILWLQIPL